MSAVQAPDLQEAAEALCSQRGFEFLGYLNRGAFKSAYLIEANGEQFALKLAVVGGAPERLVREAAALQTCSHPSIAKLEEAFPYQYDTTLLWAVREEYLAGGTLQERLKQRLLSPSETRGIGICLAEVIKHLRERRLVHRDIKPANIMFRDNPDVPVLTDFGVVRMLDHPTLTRAFLGMGPGTPAYAAPEQLNNEKPLIGWRTDQFGLAVVLAECLTGHHPFLPAGGSVHEAIMAVAAKSSPPQRAMDELRALGFAFLERALMPWPVQRFRDPDEFISAIRTP